MLLAAVEHLWSLPSDQVAYALALLLLYPVALLHRMWMQTAAELLEWRYGPRFSLFPPGSVSPVSSPVSGGSAYRGRPQGSGADSDSARETRDQDRESDTSLRRHTSATSETSSPSSSTSSAATVSAASPASKITGSPKLSPSSHRRSVDQSLHHRAQLQRRWISAETASFLWNRASLLTSLITSESLCHLFSPVVTLSIGSCVFGSIYVYNAVGISIVVYLFALHGEAWFGSRQKAALYAMTLVYAHLLACHVHCTLRKYGEYSLDYSSPLMILTQRLTSFIWDYADGAKPPQKLDHHQKKCVIVDLPSFSEYLGFTFYYGGFLVGPLIEYQLYTRSIQAFFRGNGAWQGAMNPRVGAVRLLQAFGCTFVFSLSAFFPLESLAHNERWIHVPLIIRFLYMFLAVQILRYKYYAVWAAGEGACWIADIGSEPPKEVGGDIHRPRNICIQRLEAATSMEEVIENWNVGTRKWLKHYVYLRLKESFPGFYFRHVLGTYITSAVWHGIYPAYIVTFGFGALATYIFKYVKNLVDSVSHDNIVKGWLRTRWGHLIAVGMCWFVAQTCIDYIVVPFLLLDVVEGLRVWYTVGFVYHIAAAIFLALILSNQRYKFIHMTTIPGAKDYGSRRKQFSDEQVASSSSLSLLSSPTSSPTSRPPRSFSSSLSSSTNAGDHFRERDSSTFVDDAGTGVVGSGAGAESGAGLPQLSTSDQSAYFTFGRKKAQRQHQVERDPEEQQYYRSPTSSLTRNHTPRVATLPSSPLASSSASDFAGRVSPSSSSPMSSSSASLYPPPLAPPSSSTTSVSTSSSFSDSPLSPQSPSSFGSSWRHHASLDESPSSHINRSRKARTANAFDALGDEK